MAKHITMEEIRNHYKPGNVIYVSYWGKYDKVLDYQEKSNWSFTVTVQECDINGNITGNIRQHCTMPDKRDRIINN
jgi:hypothetical protein